MRTLVIAFLLVAVAAVGLPAPAEAQLTSSLSGMVCAASGEVYYAEPDMPAERACYGRGIPNATVTLVAANPAGEALPRSATTDEGGWFRFDDVPRGDYTVRVARAGFDDAQQKVTVPAKDLYFTLAAKKVQATGAVTGSGKAVADALVRFCCNPPDYQSIEARTGNDGTFAVALAAGWHDVSVRAPGHQELYRLVFVDGQAALQLDLKPLPAPDAAVAGVVRDQDGNPVSGARVEAWSYDAYPTPRPMSPDGADGGTSIAYPEPYPYESRNNFTFSAADGSYRLGIMSGTVSLSAQKEGHAGTWREVSVERGATAGGDLVLPKYPEKTARIEGRIVDQDGRAVPHVYVSVEAPLFGLHECGSSDEVPRGDLKPAADVAESIVYPGYGGCAITVGSDGAFSGLVTPGYTTLRVHHDAYRACEGDRSSGGSSCGPQYVGWVRTMDLPADATTRVTVVLQQRSAPDAVVSGYVVDRETGKAVPGVRVSFSHQFDYGYGWATTDEDGSYALRLRSGPHELSVWADGYLPWAGSVDVPAGSMDLDIPLQPGMASGGGCCYYAMEDRAVATDGEAGGVPPSAMPGPSGSDDMAEGDADAAYEDLGGGLGPYNADARKDARIDTETKESPAPGLLLAVALLGAVAVLRRR